MSDDNVIQFRPIPAMASDKTIDELWKLLQETDAPQHVPELFFSTKKRHELARTKCSKCLCNFPPDTVCPNCGSKAVEPFTGVSPIDNHDCEATLSLIDPEWRERFHGDSGAALDYYMRRL